MAKSKLTMSPKKVRPVQNEHGELTDHGFALAHKYAKKWVDGFIRDVGLEREYPELEHLFQDIRVDSELAFYHAMPLE